MLHISVDFKFHAGASLSAEHHVRLGLAEEELGNLTPAGRLHIGLEFMSHGGGDSPILLIHKGSSSRLNLNCQSTVKK